MNQFNERQLGVIRSLGTLYYDKTSDWAADQMPKEVRDSLREQYLEAIIEGLTDPDYWKE